jgi:hypothetical protein
LDASDGEGFTDKFRRIVGARYRLLPYIYAQVRLCSEEPPDARGALLRGPGGPGQMHGGGRVDVWETRIRNIYLLVLCGAISAVRGFDAVVY